MKNYSLTVPNYLDTTLLTFEEIELCCKNSNYDLVFDREHRLDEVEKTPFPMFNTLFYNETTRLSRIPTQEELWKAYLKLYPQYNDLPEHYHLALKYRCYKAYPSYVRDLHFALYLKSKSKNAKVI